MKTVTQGQRAALDAVAAMVRGPAPHAVLLAGPQSSGKTTLALDLAAGLLCTDPNPSARPCRECRGCRQVASGNHPDLHRLAPEGPGGQIRIGKAGDPDPGTVRHLVTELALLPVEGGARVAIVEAAHRMNEDAQNALLKTLEEPPPGVTIVLCADDDERLLPTVRSRCVRVRLGTVAVRDIEAWLAEIAGVDAPTAARAARLSAGRPGLALAYVRAPAAARIRSEMARSILDLLRADRRTRLAAARSLAASAASLNAALAQARQPSTDGEAAPKRRGRASKTGGNAAAAPPVASDRGVGAAGLPDPADSAGSASSAGTVASAASRDVGSATSESSVGSAGDGSPATGAGSATEARASASAATAADRRGAALTLLEVWAAVARDLALAARATTRQIDDADLLDDLVAASPGVDGAAISAFLIRLGDVACQLDENVNPELALDVVALSWPHASRLAGESQASRVRDRAEPAES